MVRLHTVMNQHQPPPRQPALDAFLDAHPSATHAATWEREEKLSFWTAQGERPLSGAGQHSHA